MFKYILVFIVFFSVLLNLACKTSLEPIDVNYFPMEVGNKWEYGNTFSMSIYSTTKCGEYLYYIYGNNSLNYADTLRMDNSGRIWEYIDGKDYLKFDFSAKHGSKYEYNPYSNSETVTVTKNITVETEAGRFGNCISFYFDVPSSMDEESLYIFARGVGIINFGSPHWGMYHLSSYSLK